jgi:beta-barrel assembly-enhancing protease
MIDDLERSRVPEVRTAWLVARFGVLAVLGSCATATTRNMETMAAKAFVSSDQENQIGLQLKNDLDQNQKVVYLTDPTVVTYVRAVADKVITFGKRDRSDVKWQVFVIDAKTVNAFATPGGFLYVYRGLLETAQNEAELAGVMAHETGHVVARHAARSMVDQYGLDAVIGLAAGQNPGLLTQLSTGIATKGLLLHHSRSDETEADEYGARYASEAGYDPHALTTMFEHLKKLEGTTPAVLTYLSDHPATQDRIDHLNTFIVEQHLGGTELGTPAYAAMSRHLATLPPSPAPVASPSGAPPPLSPTTPARSPASAAPAGAPPPL